MEITYTRDDEKERKIIASEGNPVSVMIRAVEIARELQNEGYQPEGIDYIADTLKLISKGINQCADPYRWIMKL